MDGVTDASFRTLVSDLGGLGASCTEFVRISIQPLPRKVLRASLGQLSETVPTAIQMMAPGAQHIAETIACAEDLGAAWVDINFGCPAKRVFNRCAGSALLEWPDTMAEIIQAARSGTSLPVTAKIRAGIADADTLDDILDAVCEAGAGMVALHARVRNQAYSMEARWDWIAQAAERCHAYGVPLVGNGGIECAADIQRMREQTNCDGVMVGRAALRNPWIFAEAAGLPTPTKQEAIAFIERYYYASGECLNAVPALGRIKQMVKVYNAGNCLTDNQRQQILREQDAEKLLRLLQQIAEEP